MKVKEELQKHRIIAFALSLSRDRFSLRPDRVFSVNRLDRPNEHFILYSFDLQLYRTLFILRPNTDGSLRRSLLEIKEFDSIMNQRLSQYSKGNISPTTRPRYVRMRILSSYFYAATTYLIGEQEEMDNPSTAKTKSPNPDAHFLAAIRRPVGLAGARTRSSCNLGDDKPEDEDLEMAEHGFNTWYFEDEETGELVPSWKWPEICRNS